MQDNFYLYFPDCKIIKANLVPNPICTVISFYIKSLKNTPKHYPKHVLLDGKAEFYFGLELTENFKSIHSSNYFNVFNQTINESVTKLKGKEISALLCLSDKSTVKLETIGIGIKSETIYLHNEYITPKEIKYIANSAKLNYSLINKDNYKNKKTKI